MLKTYLKASTSLANFKDRLAGDDRGAALVEYSVLIGMITVASVLLIGAVGGWVTTKWTALTGALGVTP